jgi:flagellar biosynthesis protein FlhG
MKQTKKLGRGLEDFSHLFISSPAKAKKPPPETHQGSLMQEERVSAPARTICIVSHKTLDERAFLVINLALEIARQGKKVLVLDGDFSFPRLTMLMEGFTATSLVHLITQKGQAFADVHETDGVKLITLDVDLSTLSALGHDERRRLIESFNKLEEESDVILVVASPSFIHHMKTLIHAVDEAMVITPHPLAEMINAYGLIKLIFQMKENVRVGIVSSSVTNALQADMMFEKMKRVVEKFLHKPLYTYGFIPDDGEIVNALKKRHPRSAQSSSKVFKSITDISRTLFEMDPRGDRALGKDNTTRGFAEKLCSQLDS